MTGAARMTLQAERLTFDGILIIGAGLAGLCAALAAAPRRVLVLNPAPLGQDCASAWAQGGMAGALARDDSPLRHAADTLAAGAGLCEAPAVEVLTTEGPDAILALAALGAPFDRHSDGSFILSLEAAHSRPRVARVGGDGAGAAIMAAVIAAARAAPQIEIYEDTQALCLLQDGDGRVRGALIRRGDVLIEMIAPATLLATGGLGGLYGVTTDPATVRGEGLALAALAGARILDPEFVQFHPTAMDFGVDPAPLATEALRGAGARLVNADGRPFMEAYDDAGDLAARDIVARAIETERRAGRGAFLDARVGPIGDVAHEFPAVFAACRRAGLDPRASLIPVLPAAHYHMGGVATDLHGATSLDGLFAAGECAAPGVHGANRLASNSLVEAAVFGARAGLACRDQIAPAASPGYRRAPAPPTLPPDVLAALRGRMSRDAGVVRDGAGLARLLAWIEACGGVHGPALPLVAAGLVARAAYDRRESRGAHFRADYPATEAAAIHTLITLAGDAIPRRRAA